LRFRRRPLPAHALIHQRRKPSISGFDLAKHSRILHILIKGQETQMIKLFSRAAFHPDPAIRRSLISS
jgi:5-keto 4-deoxyuronate isomerase